MALKCVGQVKVCLFFCCMLLQKAACFVLLFSKYCINPSLQGEHPTKAVLHFDLKASLSMIAPESYSQVGGAVKKKKKSNSFDPNVPTLDLHIIQRVDTSLRMS